VGDTAYAPCGDLSIAYQVFGDGDINVLFAGSFVSHLELFWTVPEAKAFFDRLGTFCRVAWFDKAGVGLSDPVPKVRSIDDRVAEVEAVMDAAGFQSAALLGVSEGGPASIMYAATHPERVRALILTGTFAWTGFASWDDLDAKATDLRDRILRELDEKYVPSVEQIGVIQRFAEAIRSEWGTGKAIGELLPSIKSARQRGALERMSASPGMARATIEAAMRIDVRSVLSAINVPTLVIHARDDPVPFQGGLYLADHIPGARLVAVEGRDHAPWFTDPDGITAAIEEFLTGTHRAPPSTHRALRTVLFTDMVSSTARAASVGDERWRAVLERFDDLTREVTARFGGTVVKGTGDGHLMTFEGPTQSIRAAEALRSDAESAGIDIRAGIHTGECELLGDDIGGIAVHIAARIVGEAGAGEIVVSSAVRDLVVGSGIGFSDRGATELKGVPGEWHLLTVDPHRARPGSAEANLASTPTPPPQEGMRRSDRAVAVLARRTPWLLRGMARLSTSSNGS